VETVCLTLGPYRNLTTLTASVLFLHPNCQVLNHAGKRIYGNSEVDFFLDFEPRKLDRFIQYAIHMSASGERGPAGGSIVHSHAFDSEHGLNRIFARSGVSLVKDDIVCLHWKESLRTSNAIRDRGVDLASILRQDERLRFLLPIRQPLDCAASNVKTGHARLFRGLNRQSPMSDVVEGIVDEVVWFAGLRERFPDRFRYYFEHEISREMLVGLAEFLRLEPTEPWVAAALEAMEIKSSYEHDAEHLDHYRRVVEQRSSGFPDLTRGLLKFVE
jgi:hypothetical protein